ncbi:hypothetical protein CEUSTIGMA_g6967.t1 [Chlamydomonas eustigma]|uniref:Protein kinase domain-containing protein n=1 Tax=Chlamydomonas eustigma TaxID=1157962 RepID=A0A250X8Y7_9CHLO|nr:hypothetical protein CEUSTIGMA_g6967.t1 [Chlamydomonas eustigma]|eukprot:GAX79526.1 hypothetical protein CEUSTIGMA_g6967.t1 [Chlamydomonas eustigma]
MSKGISCNQCTHPFSFDDEERWPYVLQCCPKVRVCLKCKRNKSICPQCNTPFIDATSPSLGTESSIRLDLAGLHELAGKACDVFKFLELCCGLNGVSGYSIPSAVVAILNELKGVSGSCVRTHRGLLSGQEVAVKVFQLPTESKSSDVGKDQSYQKLTVSSSLARELLVQMYATKDCPHVCPSKGLVGEADGCLKVVSTLHPNNLQQYVAKQAGEAQLSSSEVLRLSLDIALGLKELHSLGLVAATLHPGNVLITSEGVAVLSDAGLSPLLERLLSRQDIVSSGSDKNLGFRAPEYMGGKNEGEKKQEGTACKADVWALGCIVSYMSTGKTFLAGLNPMQAMRKVVVQGAVPPIHQDLPAAFQSVLLRCFNLIPELRPSASEIVEVIQSCTTIQIQPSMLIPSVAATAGPQVKETAMKLLGLSVSVDPEGQQIMEGYASPIVDKSGAGNRGAKGQASPTTPFSEYSAADSSSAVMNSGGSVTSLKSVFSGSKSDEASKDQQTSLQSAFIQQSGISSSSGLPVAAAAAPTSRFSRLQQGSAALNSPTTSVCPVATVPVQGTEEPVTAVATEVLPIAAAAAAAAPVVGVALRAAAAAAAPSMMVPGGLQQQQGRAQQVTLVQNRGPQAVFFLPSEGAGNSRSVVQGPAGKLMPAAATPTDSPASSVGSKGSGRGATRTASGAKRGGVDKDGRLIPDSVHSSPGMSSVYSSIGFSSASSSPGMSVKSAPSGRYAKGSLPRGEEEEEEEDVDEGRRSFSVTRSCAKVKPKRVVLVSVVEVDGEDGKKVQKVVRYQSEDEQEETEGVPPLVIACKAGRLAEAADLLARGDSNVNAADKNGVTSLHWAVRTGFKKVTALLLNHKANKEAADKNGQTPVHYAAREGKKECLLMLLEGLEKLDHPKETGLLTSIVDIFKSDGRKAAVDVNKMDKNGWTALHHAAYGGHEQCMVLLLNRGANVDKADKDMWTPLHTASQRGWKECAFLLVEFGSNVNATTRDCLTPLHCAAKRNDKDLSLMLIHKGADIEASSKLGRTPLDFAARRGNLECVSLFIAKGANVDTMDEDGRTPLYWTSTRGHYEVMQILLDKKASPNLADKDGASPLHEAVRCSLRSLECTTLLIMRGAMLDAYTRGGGTPLHWAARTAQPEVIALLLNNGANVVAQTKDGRTPLHWAAEAGKVEASAVLLQYGARPDIQDKNRDTPVDLAVRCGYKHLESMMMESMSA